ncbi:unnamed protein product [Prorocentrum cordatum]|uniref:Peroxisomal membrane protein MPV17 n=1 Tax=Prorocentrum cordatum TaxID=2364126 RepID=A0ABN9YDV9_9DINO|nr:unnamed protein product [Polarella glacialis]
MAPPRWRLGRRPPLAAALAGGTASVPAPGGLLAAVGASYSQALVAHPIPAKSLTAGLLFAGADAAAQRIEAAKGLDKRRVGASAAVGLMFFGPAAHLWFRWVLRLVPGHGLLSLFAKTALGQVFFGPYITTVFFAASLWCNGELSVPMLRRKISADLWPTILAGLGFWPIVET